MEELWSAKEKIVEYSTKRTTISDTFGGNKNDNVCYVRKYKTLSDMELLSLIADAKANQWTSLDLSECGISELPEELWTVSSLRVLYLGNVLPDEEDNNTIKEISESIEKLQNLEALSVSNLQGIRIPKTFKKLPKLVYLDCFGCDFQKIPNNLLNRNIRGIGIECSSASQLLQICKISKIEEIFLTGSSLKELPNEIGDLKKLRILYLRDAQIESIPDSMMNLKQITKFEIINTPLAEKIPDEMRKQNAYDLIAYICKQQRQQEIYSFNESKMIIVGQGNVGKSCLVERITQDKYEEKESTEGIDVKEWIFFKNNKRYSLNIWDFGGQEIYHSTHQFFLTKRSLYIFVWDARAEEEYGRIDYWLKTIESFADDSPIIIAINKCDEKTTRVNRIDLKEYKEKYPQITNILDISCKDNINIKALRNIIKKQASKLPITKEKWLKSWFDIRTEIEELSEERRFITFDEFRTLCKKYNVENEEAKSLSKYLHDIGVILHYQEDILLNGIVILSPEWATSAVYKILDSQENVLAKRNGILYLSDLPKIWNNKEIYPEDKHVFLLRIMEKFQLCFELDKESYLVAELLENTAIDCPKDWNFNSDSCMSIVYRYDFMPAGVMTRFIVKIHDYIANVNGKNLCWRKGVYLKYKTAFASVIMKDSISEKKIEVKVSKNNNSLYERELLYYIRSVIKDVNSNFKKIQVEEYVPCNCSSNCRYQFPYKTLCNALENKVDTIQCYESFAQVNVLKLLEGIEIMKQEEKSPYNISIQNNPVISNTISIDNNVTQNQIEFGKLKKLFVEMQGDISEIKDEMVEKLPVDKQKKVQENLEKLKEDLAKLEKMKSSDEVLKSGKLNKLKRWLIEFADEKSEIRKTLSGVKNITAMVSGLVLKFNALAEKLGISLIPPFVE